jgi:hypothetical protein
MTTVAPLPDKDQCAICKTETGLNSCKSCLVVFYCGRDHQKEDWPTHKRFCKHTKMTRETNWRALEHLKQLLEENPNDNPRDFFASHPDDVNAYLHVRYIYARAILRLGTRSGVEGALESCLEIVGMDRNNEQNGQDARDHVPTLFLRLGRDKECYGFLKEECVGDLEEIYAYDENGALRQPADAEKLSLAHAAMLSLLKVRILIDLRHLQSADDFVGDKLPTELSDQIRSYDIGAATRIDAARMKAIEKHEDLVPLMKKLKAELKDLRVYVNALNKDYWAAILDPEKYKNMQPMYQPELPIVQALSQTYDAWAETPEALACWKGLCEDWGVEGGVADAAEGAADASDEWVDVD